jgi:regulator of protease activity HflC (stomatin/prohibitin superfamily)
MIALWIVLAALVVLPASCVRIVTQYEKGVLFRLGRLQAVRELGTLLNRESAAATRPVPGAVGNTNGSPVTAGG